MSEFAWIATYFAPLAGEGALGLKDDAALLKVPHGQQLVITTDTLNEGVHFKAGTSPKKIAQKALRVNLSDLAAKGATPIGYTLNLSLPIGTSEAFIEDFCAGLKADQAQFDIALLGGDTTRTLGPLSISITAFGACITPLLRSGAKVGDGVYVSGSIGAGFLGLHNHSPKTIAHYELPTPRLALGRTLVGLAHSCMDVSDGLVQDMGHLCAASGVGADIQLSAIPLADNAYDAAAQLTGGDDYELLFTLPPDASAPQGCTRIGTITAGSMPRFLDAEGQEVTFERGGWQHF